MSKHTIGFSKAKDSALRKPSHRVQSSQTEATHKMTVGDGARPSAGLRTRIDRGLLPHAVAVAHQRGGNVDLHRSARPHAHRGTRRGRMRGAPWAAGRGRSTRHVTNKGTHCFRPLWFLRPPRSRPIRRGRSRTRKPPSARRWASRSLISALNSTNASMGGSMAD